MLKNTMNTEHINTLVLGGGISAIAFAHFYNKNDYLIIEQDDRLGGLCKSFKVGDSIFDYSGHFMHFNNPDMKEYIMSLMSKHATGEFKAYDRVAGIAMLYKGRVERVIDYPFQANIHQLEYVSFIKCLVDLYNASKLHAPDTAALKTFDELVRSVFGNAITDLFFKPYNEKLYKIPLTEMDANAMKRFIPKVTFDEVINNFIESKEFGYNSQFLYSPTTGIQGVIDAFLKEKELNAALNEKIVAIDTVRKTVTTDKRTITYDTLINTLPIDLFNKLAKHDPLDLKSVDVHVYNITFESNSSHGENFCWLYFPGEVPFYRVGFYNHMSGKEDTSVYVEMSTRHNSDEEALTMEEMIQKLMKAGVIFGGAPVKDSQKLVISPAYAILEPDTEEKVSTYRKILEEVDVHCTGRYSTWNYQSIEDNILDAQSLAIKLNNRNERSNI